MIKHYLLISWRNILHNKFYTAILVIGLAIGIASSLLLWTYTWKELTYDNFHVKKDRIFLVGVHRKEGVEETKSGWTSPPTGPALQYFFPSIEHAVRLCFWFDDVLVTKGEKQFVEDNIIGADSTIFNVFTIPFIAGDPQTALTEPNSVVITEKISKKYFGNESAIGQTLRFHHFFNECKITGVIRDFPDNSHFDMDILLSLSSLETIKFDFNHWGNHTFSTYVLLKENTGPEIIESRLPQFVEKNLNPYLIEQLKKSYDELMAEGNTYSMFLMPLKDVHLSTMLFENREGKKMLTFALGAIGCIIILLVTINYTNLATVLTFSRAKEVGIRKASGSNSDILLKQFLVESVLIVFIGLFIGLGIVEIVLPVFNSITNQTLSFQYSDPKWLGGLFGFAIGLGVLSGLYPAWTFSRFNAIQALKGNTIVKSSAAWIRNSLVVFQFTICIVMIASTLTIFKQLSFMTTKDAGFAKDQILVIKRPEGLNENKVVFKNEIIKHPGIVSLSYSETTPGRHFNGHGQHFAGTPPSELPTIFPLVADEDILRTLDLEIIEGNSFQESKISSGKAILNEAAARMLHFKKPLEQIIDRGTLGHSPVPVIGIVKDFHYQSFHHAIEPLVIYSLDIENDVNHRASFILVRFGTGDVQTTLKYIESLWAKFAPETPLEYSFLDQDFNQLFTREITMTKVYTLFSIIAISIASLGLLGLASFFVNKRTKEIGIRKIVGASALAIAGVLLRDFAKWIFISIIIGSCISWYIMQQWLQNFAYQTPLSWWVFAVAGMCVIVIAFATVSWHMYQAATRNPTESLRYE